ncbi:MAG: DUF1844 domain-containing protein [Planctomycetota bacterium]|jgi:hypothetical protein
MTEQDSQSPDEGIPGGLPEASFLMMIAGISTQVMMNLGEIANPVSGETRADLGHAKYNIDLLGILKEKTEGNLTDEETRALDMTLYELRVKYVNAVGGGK